MTTEISQSQSSANQVEIKSQGVSMCKAELLSVLIVHLILKVYRCSDTWTERNNLFYVFYPIFHLAEQWWTITIKSTGNINHYQLWLNLTHKLSYQEGCHGNIDQPIRAIIISSDYDYAMRKKLVCATVSWIITWFGCILSTWCIGRKTRLTQLIITSPLCLYLSKVRGQTLC